MSEHISITVNGAAEQAAPGATVAQMLLSLGIDGDRVAVERNLEILPRAAWGETKVAPGDRFEIVQFVGGG
jgi:sulfur carrier protein